MPISSYCRRHVIGAARLLLNRFQGGLARNIPPIAQAIENVMWTSPTPVDISDL